MTTAADLGLEQGLLYIDKELVCEVEEPTVVELLTLWLAAHYVFNIEYAKETINMAFVLEDCVLMGKGLNSIQNMSMKGNKSRKVARSNKLQTLYARLKSTGFIFNS